MNTKRAAFEIVKATGVDVGLRSLVRDCLKDNGPMTHTEITKKLNWKFHTSVGARINELIKSGEVEVVGAKLDVLSGHTVEMYAVTGATPKIINQVDVDMEKVIRLLKKIEKQEDPRWKLFIDRITERFNV